MVWFCEEGAKGFLRVCDILFADWSRGEKGGWRVGSWDVVS